MSAFLSVIIKAFSVFLTWIIDGAKRMWAHPTWRIPSILILFIVVLIIHESFHDASILKDNNAQWQAKIDNMKSSMKIETTYVDRQLPATHQTKPATPINNEWKKKYQELAAKWDSSNADKDSLLAYYTEPVQAVFEDSTEIDTIGYYPAGFPPRHFSLDKYPKVQHIPVVHITETDIMNGLPYKKLQWLNPRLHADLFPFTNDGLLMGLSASICSYGTGAEQKDILFYFPEFGIATNTKNILIAQAGIRWNFAHYIGFIQDTHLVIGYSTQGKMLIGIGTSL
jgi:hypothetical protein